ncbi:LysM peptidoglycan-binding domain-containing protein [Metapseudomonas otitidis]|uniref:LysM peptidoglycan-binding domain-containing protein n=1 Tax=Metapseudomonas otitidis TaxID=319939 RepID=UPI0013F5DC94|nr:LysM domain-containing protein [Pseudomonas otitidis]
METTNHKIQPGETLGSIAERYNCTLAELRQLNPFIRGSDHIQVGWNLSVPKRAGAKPQQPQAAAKPAASSNGKPSDVLDLPARAKATESRASECFKKAASPGCSPRFSSVLYATKEKAFWLLPQRAEVAIKEAARHLGDLVSPSLPPDDRKRGLDESGLLEYFLEPRLSYFLAGDEQARMQGFESRFPHMEHTWGYERAMILSDPRMQAFAHHRKRLKEIDEWLGLRKTAVRNAEARGYKLESGHLLSPEALAARDAVQAYLKVRGPYLKEKKRLDANYKQLTQLLIESSRRFEEAHACRRRCQGKLNSYLKWRDENKDALDFAAYVNAILDVADYGLAVPEFALIGLGNTDPTLGVKHFTRYLDLMRQQQSIEQQLLTKYQQWVRAAGENIRPPNGLFDAERKAWAMLDAELGTLQKEAAENVRNSKPSRHLLWEPEQFAPRPVERLVRPDFPLREVSLPDTPGLPLRHFSLEVLRKLLPVQTKARAKFTGFTANNADIERAESEFKIWLQEVGAVEVPDQGPWFEPEGWFDVERFHRYLEGKRGYHVDSLQKASDRKEWGERLRQLVFRDDMRRRLRLFNPTSQAQLVRCLMPPRGNIHTVKNLKGPSFSLTGGLSASAEVSMELDLAQGEVELFRLDLPERSAAKDLKLAYLNHQKQPAQLNIGRFSLHLGARAWGFAGAALMLSSKLSLSPRLGQGGADVSTVQQARRPGTLSAERTDSSTLLSGPGEHVQLKDGLKSSFNLFAGVQAGIKLTGALNWAPPKHLVLIRQAPNLANGESPADGWLTLAQLQASLSVAAGLGLKGEVGLSLEKGCLILRLKAAVIAGPGAEGAFSFAVGYEAVGELINLVRRELRQNNYHHLEWIDGDAFAWLSKLNLLGGLGVDVGMVSLLAIRSADVVGNLYEALTSSGKGGPIAHAILNYENQRELSQWFVDAIPEALGPLLMTLLSPPKAFDLADPVDTAKFGEGQLIKDGKAPNVVDPASTAQAEEISMGGYDEDGCLLLQQRAIERVLRWIVSSARSSNTLTQAQRQFVEACSRMNRFGTREKKSGQSYCENRLRMDDFMEKVAGALGRQRVDGERIRASYKEVVKVLSASSDKYCRRSNFYGVTYLSSKRVIYTGPGE